MYNYIYGRKKWNSSKILSNRSFSKDSCLAEASVVDETRVGRGAGDNESRTEERRGAREGIVVDAASALVDAVRHRLEEQRRRGEAAASRRHVAVREAAQHSSTKVVKPVITNLKVHVRIG